MGFFQGFWGWLSSQLSGYIGDNTARVAAALEPAVVTLGTLYVMAWGYLQLTGRIEEPLVAGLKRIVSLALVLGVALRLWLYNSVIVDTFYNAPAQFAATVIGATDPATLAALRFGLGFLLLLPIAVGLARLRFNVEIFDLLPGNLPVVAGLKLYQQHFASARELIVTVQASEPERTENAARTIAEDLRKEALFLGFAAIRNQRRTQQRNAKNIYQRRRGRPGHLFDKDGLVDQGRAAAAVFFWPMDAHPTGFEHLLLPGAKELEPLPGVFVVKAGGVPAFGDVGMKPGPELVAKALFGRRRIKVHVLSSL